MIISSRVAQNRDSATLIDYLANRFTYLSREEWLLRLSENRFLINDTPQTDPKALLHRDDVITYDMPDFVEPPADFNYKIIYEDDHILAVDKTGNLLVHHSGKSFRSNLIYQLRYCTEPARYGEVDVINRLDRETSGVVLLAKDKTTLRIMNDNFANRAMHKEYVAIVNGCPTVAVWTENSAIGKKVGSLIRYKYCVDPENGKPAETRFEVIQNLGGSASMIKAIPITGRTHQIRVHLAFVGLPIIGDKLYGMPEEEFLSWRDDTANYKGVLAFPRQALHCSRIGFIHPVTKKEICIEAALPQDMAALVAKLKA